MLHATTIKKMAGRMACRALLLSVTLLACLSAAAAWRAGQASLVALQTPTGYVSLQLDDAVWVLDVRSITAPLTLSWQASVRHRTQQSLVDDLVQITLADLETPGSRLWHGPGLGFCYHPTGGVSLTMVYIRHKVVWLVALTVLAGHMVWRFRSRGQTAAIPPPP